MTLQKWGFTNKEICPMLPGFQGDFQRRLELLLHFRSFGMMIERFFRRQQMQVK